MSLRSFISGSVMDNVYERYASKAGWFHVFLKNYNLRKWYLFLERITINISICAFPHFLMPDRGNCWHGQSNSLSQTGALYVLEKHCHGGARQASNPWTAGASSLLALISRESTQHVRHTTRLYIHMVNHNAWHQNDHQPLHQGTNMSHAHVHTSGDHA